MTEVKKLINCPEYAGEAAEMLFSYFGKAEMFTYEFFNACVCCAPGTDGLPVTLVAFFDGKPAGVVCLWRSDLLTRQDLSPWLANLFVKEEYRGKHIGAALQNALCEYAENLGFEKVYLYTDLVNYYEKTDWVSFSQGTELDGSCKRIYYRRAGNG